MFVRAAFVCSVALTLAVGQPVLHAQEHPMAPRGEFLPRHLDTGERGNPDEVSRVVFTSIVHTPQAIWTRLYFSDVHLEAGSTVRFTSLFDGEIQELDADRIAMWSNTSAYFNGDIVLIELIAAPGTRRNRLVLEEVAVETADGPIGNHCTPPLCGICGEDDRTPSDELWAGRLAPGGCSASVYNEQSCAVSAGHCMGSADIIQFNVPPSTPGCELQQPPVDDQFPIVEKIFQNAGVGADWAVLTIGTNDLGETPYDRYGEFKPVASSVPSSGPIQIFGYGISETCTATQSQQLSLGGITGVDSTAIFHNADTTCGNSGSNMLHEDLIIGVVTHCSCPNNSNIATRVDVPAFVAARDDLCGIPEEVTVPGDYPSIQAAIDAVSSGSTITVLPGTYPEAINFLGKHLAVVSSGGPEVTVIDASGLGASVARFSNSESAQAVLDGFTLTGGTGSAVNLGGTGYILGGGVYAAGSAPTIVNCIITGNTAEFGGGMFNNSASPTVQNCTFDSNAADPSSGGGVFNFSGAAPQFIDTTFIGNTAAANGGAMSNQGANPVVTGCDFIDNHAQTNGGAIRNIQSSAGQFTDCTFENNIAGGTGGAFFNDESPATAVGETEFCGNAPDHISGSHTDAGGNVFEDACTPPVPGDINGDGVVDVDDLLLLLDSWGPCADPEECPADLDGDGVVDVDDLLILLTNWA